MLLCDISMYCTVLLCCTHHPLSISISISIHEGEWYCQEGRSGGRRRGGETSWRAVGRLPDGECEPRQQEPEADEDQRRAKEYGQWRAGGATAVPQREVREVIILWWGFVLSALLCPVLSSCRTCYPITPHSPFSNSRMPPSPPPPDSSSYTHTHYYYHHHHREAIEAQRKKADYERRHAAGNIHTQHNAI